MSKDGRVAGPDVLDYIEAILSELQPMAARNHFGVLAHLIDMARIEARDQISAHQSNSSQSNGRNKPSGLAV